MRERILDAAIEVIKERGVTGATTKEIARVAGVSEGSLYNHFDNKTVLFGSAIAAVAATIRTAMMELIGSAGQGTVEGNLTTLAAAAVRFYAELLPMTASALADPQILAWVRGGGPAAEGAPGPGAGGPVLGVVGLTAYVEAEKSGGRIASTVRPEILAAALLGGCLQHAFLIRVSGPEVVQADAHLPIEPEEYARDLVRTLLRGALADR
jgi:AcrR family transcriptional regulator